jgi:hypothetical protein
VKNLGLNERLLRAYVAEIFILTAFFWRGGEWQLLLYLVAVMFIIQAASGTCGVYTLLKWDTCKNIKRKSDKRLVYAAMAGMIVIAIAGGYGSAVLTRNIFIDDLSSVEEPYNATLNFAAQGLLAESAEEHGHLSASFSDFQAKYSRYQPLVVKFDDQFTGDLQNLSTIISVSGEDITSKNLTRAETTLKSGLPIFEGLKERNGLV